MYAKPNVFEHFDMVSMRMGLEYFAIHGRSILKPVIEIWNLDIRTEQMNVLLNSKVNPPLFQTEAINRIFNHFPLPVVFNKLPNRHYYTA